jgi:hypothetical protein
MEYWSSQQTYDIVIVDSNGNLSTTSVRPPKFTDNITMIYVDTSGNLGTITPGDVYTLFPASKNLLYEKDGVFNVISTKLFNPCHVNDDVRLPNSINGQPTQNGTCSCNTDMSGSLWSGREDGNGCSICTGNKVTVVKDNKLWCVCKQISPDQYYYGTDCATRAHILRHGTTIRIYYVDQNVRKYLTPSIGIQITTSYLRRIVYPGNSNPQDLADNIDTFNMDNKLYFLNNTGTEFTWTSPSTTSSNHGTGLLKYRDEFVHEYKFNNTFNDTFIQYCCSETCSSLSSSSNNGHTCTTDSYLKTNLRGDDTVNMCDESGNCTYTKFEISKNSFTTENRPSKQIGIKTYSFPIPTKINNVTISPNTTNITLATFDADTPLDIHIEMKEDDEIWYEIDGVQGVSPY